LLLHSPEGCSTDCFLACCFTFLWDLCINSETSKRFFTLHPLTFIKVSFYDVQPKTLTNIIILNLQVWRLRFRNDYGHKNNKGHSWDLKPDMFVRYTPSQKVRILKSCCLLCLLSQTPSKACGHGVLC
jgi:hypothetical protein